MGSTIFTTALLFMMIVACIDMTPIDSTDECIFNCYQCYSKNNLLDCANDCILMDGNVNEVWSKCKFFDNVPKVFSI